MKEEFATLKKRQATTCTKHEDMKRPNGGDGMGEGGAFAAMMMQLQQQESHEQKGSHCSAKQHNFIVKDLRNQARKGDDLFCVSERSVYEKTGDGFCS